jgi:hypothetical protein
VKLACSGAKIADFMRNVPNSVVFMPDVAFGDAPLNMRFATTPTYTADRHRSTA